MHRDRTGNDHGDEPYRQHLRVLAERGHHLVLRNADGAADPALPSDTSPDADATWHVHPGTSRTVVWSDADVHGRPDGDADSRPGDSNACANAQAYADAAAHAVAINQDLAAGPRLRRGPVCVRG